MDDQNKNLILATALSFLVILVWFFLFPPEDAAADRRPPTEARAAGRRPPRRRHRPRRRPTTPHARRAARRADRGGAGAHRRACRSAPPRLDGSISLIGGRIDDLELTDYNVTIEPNSPIVTLLQPAGAPDAYYALYGWAPGRRAARRRGARARPRAWSVESGEALTETTPVTLRWDNGAGPDLPPDDRGRRELHVHRHPVGRERHRRRGAARALRHHRPPRHAVRPARTSTSCTRARSAVADGQLERD